MKNQKHSNSRKNQPSSLMRRHSITNRYRTRVRPRVLSQTIVCVTHTNGLRFHSFQCPACPSIFSAEQNVAFTLASVPHCSTFLGRRLGAPSQAHGSFSPRLEHPGQLVFGLPLILGYWDRGVTTNPERQKWARKQQRTPCCHPF